MLGCDSHIRADHLSSGTVRHRSPWLLVVGVGVGVLNVPVNACLQGYRTTSIHTTHSAATIQRITFDGPDRRFDFRHLLFRWPPPDRAKASPGDAGPIAMFADTPGTPDLRLLLGLPAWGDSSIYVAINLTSDAPGHEGERRTYRTVNTFRNAPYRSEIALPIQPTGAASSPVKSRKSTRADTCTTNSVLRHW
jgi:hypothetical protein